MLDTMPPEDEEKVKVDLYAILEVPKDISQDDLKKIYRKLALKWHPDKNPGNAEAQMKFQEIGKAYAILSDPAKRKYYDDTGDTEEMDVSPDEFIGMFQEMMCEMLGGMSIEDMLEGMNDGDVEDMPPFPFPEKLFPAGTFPKGMKFSTEFKLPPQVEEALDKGETDLAALFEKSKRNVAARAGSDSDDDGGVGGGWFGAGGFGSDEDFDMDGLPPELLKKMMSGGGDDLDEMELMRMLAGDESFLSSMPPELRGMMDPEMMAAMGAMGGMGGFGGPTSKGKGKAQKSRATSGGFKRRTGANSPKVKKPSAQAPKASASSRPAASKKPAGGTAKQEQDTLKTANATKTEAVQLGPMSKVERDEGKRWLEHAKGGELGNMKIALGRNGALLNYTGPGIGHTALHWAAAKGELGTLLWLLRAGADVDAVNSSDSTPLHAACANGQAEAARALILAGGCSMTKKDENGDLPTNLARQRAKELLPVLRAAELASALREQPEASWDAEQMRELLTTAEVPQSAECSEAELPAMVQRYLSSVPSRMQVHSGGGKPTGGTPAAAPAPAPAPTKPASAPASAPAASTEDAGSSSEEETKGEGLKGKADAAKERGNEAFQQGDYAKAVTQYSMAIRMDKNNHVLFSNRSASHAGVGNYEKALEDADRCIKLAPKWGKGFARKGAALVGLGQGAEAVKIYLEGLKVEPENEMLKDGLDEAKESIRVAKQKYEEMWGKAPPATDAELAEAPPAPSTPPPTNAPSAAAAQASAQPTPTAAASPAPDVTSGGQAPKDSNLSAAQVAQLAGVEKTEGRAWMDAARKGDIPSMQAALDLNPALLIYRGQGTNFGFTGHTALHWAAAKGHTEATRWLIGCGVPANAPNFAGSTPLHAAAGNGQAECIKVLLVEGAADAMKPDELGETPKAVALRKEQMPCALALDCYRTVQELQAVDPASWALKDMRNLLALSGEDLNKFTEKAEIRRAASEFISALPPRAAPDPGVLQAAQQAVKKAEEDFHQGQREPAATTPVVAAQAEGTAMGPAVAQTGDSAAAMVPTAPAARPVRNVRGGEARAARIAAGESSGSSDEEDRSARLKVKSEEAKKRGNAAFQQGDYHTAVKQYSMAIRMDKTNHVLWSNRSGSHAGVGNYEKALEDANRCIRLAPKWGKGFARKGAALVGLGQGGEGVKVYLEGLKVDPDNAGLREGLNEAKEAIRMAKQRYAEYWGENNNQ
ncbi:hypothetical protein CYMTET_10925 [Cymbomonas tetramitiformis]|uniref:J domain-containing protein n=1 Tax=Cymbomonas tetramitiformis TaxID=36881 RepID=A0AAE0GPN7_9CHLO|nr:hypothetical protein CYMTET_10925 [Cymbomonas tetramitiformis]